MQITILAHGSRGDVQPYLALGLGLARAGYTIRLAAPEIFRDWIEARGLSFAPLAGNPRMLMRNAAKGSFLPAPVRAAWNTLRYVAPVADQLAQDIFAACQGADAVIHSLLTTALGRQTARLLGIPDLAALVFPVFSLTNAFPNPLFPVSTIRQDYNLLTHREFNRVFWWGSRLGIHRLRRRLPALPALGDWPFGEPAAACSACSTPILYGISRHALPPVPEAEIAERFTGYWFLDSPEWQPPQPLLEFLSAGAKPVFVGFGSLIPADENRLTKIILDALEKTGQRAVLLRGWGGGPTGSLPDWVYPVDDVPFEWLFPRVAAAVHHGGMGTTAAALRAGIPSVIVPFTFDQPFWGRQVYALGAGPLPIQPGQLSTQRLTEAIQAALNHPGIRAQAAGVGQLVRAEDGVATAVQAIEKHFRK